MGMQKSENAVSVRLMGYRRWIASNQQWQFISFTELFKI